MKPPKLFSLIGLIAGLFVFTTPFVRAEIREGDIVPQPEEEICTAEGVCSTGDEPSAKNPWAEVKLEFDSRMEGLETAQEFADLETWYRAALAKIPGDRPAWVTAIIGEGQSGKKPEGPQSRPQPNRNQSQREQTISTSQNPTSRSSRSTTAAVRSEIWGTRLRTGSLRIEGLQEGKTYRLCDRGDKCTVRVASRNGVITLVHTMRRIDITGPITVYQSGQVVGMVR